MLEVKNLCKTYKSPEGAFAALDDVSVTVNRGEVFGFIGLSGAGKTSLARCVSALEKADSGEILFCGADITKLKRSKLREARKKMGFVFQHFNLLMNSTVSKNIAFPMRLRKPTTSRFRFIKRWKETRQLKAERLARVNELLEIVGLTDKANAYPSTLSGGQKQRVGIARALATKPELVICDEATSALDPDTTRSILALIKKIVKETGVTFLVITHEMDVIKELCSHVAIMEDGKIIESGKVVDVLTSPKTDTAKRFFSKEYVNEEWLKATTPEGRRSQICHAVFIDDSARRPFINDVIRKFDVEVSILSGNIESVGGTMVGSLVLEVIGTQESVSQALKYFSDNGVPIEVINHV